MTNKEMMLAALKDSGHFIDRENNVVYVSPKFNHEAENLIPMSARRWMP